MTIFWFLVAYAVIAHRFALGFYYSVRCPTLTLTVLVSIVWPLAIVIGVIAWCWKAVLTRRAGVVILLLTSQAQAEGMVLPPGNYVNRTFDAAGDPFAVKLTAGEYRFTNSKFSNAKYYCLDADGPVRLTVEGCEFHDSMHGIRLRGAAKGLVAHSSVRGWLHYGVLIEGTETDGPVVTIDGCTFEAPKAGKGGARAMIFATNPKKVVNVEVHVSNTRCLGPGQQYEPRNDKSIGTSDQISLNFCSRFSVTHTVSSGGGENGMTATNGSCNGFIFASTFSGNNGHGLQISSAVDVQAHDIVATGNRLTDNGKFHGVEKDTIAGLYIHGGKRISAIGNEIVGETRYGVLASESELIAIRGNDIRSKRSDQIPVQVFADKPLEFDHTWGVYQKATLNSPADPIAHVTADDVTISDLTFNGRFKDDGVRQRGIFSETGKRGTIQGCKFAGMTNGVKLDRAADGWTIEDCEFKDIIGVKDGYGYGILFGICGGHRVTRCSGVGTPGRMRHFGYVSGGSSGNTFTDCHVTGANSSSFAVYAKADQRPCTGNVFERCTVTNQLTGHDGSHGGAVETGAFELTGWTSDTTIRDCSAKNIATNGIVVNTLGLDAEGVTIERFRLDGCDQIGLWLVGARKVHLLKSELLNVSRAAPGKRGAVEVHPWWKTEPKRASKDIVIRGNRFKGKGVLINPTLPKPEQVIQQNNQIAM